MQLPVADSKIRTETDIDRLLMGMAYQLAEAEDHTIVEDLRGKKRKLHEFKSLDEEVIEQAGFLDHWSFRGAI
jgi:DNA invertase Pin-like site-specific DNA recombinase